MLSAPALRMPVRVPAIAPMLARGYASGGGLSHEEIRSRIEDVIKSFEKVNPQKVGSGCQARSLTQVSPGASFTTELGLDSLDTVELVMAIEEEFNIVRVSHHNP